jgi:hypothetical protein
MDGLCPFSRFSLFRPYHKFAGRRKFSVSSTIEDEKGTFDTHSPVSPKQSSLQLPQTKAPRMLRSPMANILYTEVTPKPFDVQRKKPIQLPKSC